MNFFFHKKCQQDWYHNIHKKLFQIKPNIGEWKKNKSLYPNYV